MLLLVKLHALFGIELLTKRAFPGGSVVKNLPDNARDTGDLGLIPGLGRSTGGGSTVCSSILAWKSPWTEEPDCLESIGSQSRTQLSTRAPHFTVGCKTFIWETIMFYCKIRTV